MTIRTRITFENTDQRVVEKLRARFPRVLERIRVQMNNEMDDLQAYIVNEKLSGQVLNHGEGGLAGSVRRMETVVTDQTVQGGVQAGGGPFWWAIVHEKGGEKSYEILPGALTGKSDKKALAFYGGGSIGAGAGIAVYDRSILRQVRRAVTNGAGSVRAKAIKKFSSLGGMVVRKVIHPPLPKRAFMAPSLEERRPVIVEGLRSALIKGLRLEE